LPAATSTSSRYCGTRRGGEVPLVAAVITNPVVNGVKDTPTRRVINRAVQFLSTPRTCFRLCRSYDHHHLPACSPEILRILVPRRGLFRPATHQVPRKALSARPRLDSPHLRGNLVGGQGHVQLEPIVADGGELVSTERMSRPPCRSCTASRLSASATTCATYFVKQWDRFATNRN